MNGINESVDFNGGWKNIYGTDLGKFPAFYIFHSPSVQSLAMLSFVVLSFCAFCAIAGYVVVCCTFLLCILSLICLLKLDSSEYDDGGHHIW